MLVLMLTIMLGGAAQVRPDVVLIDGSKDPQLVPEYLMWRNAFDVLAQASQNSREIVLKALKLPEVDKSIVAAEARAQAQREAACQDRQKRRVKALQAADAESRITKEVQHIALGCRQEVLDAKDRVMRALSPESQLILQGWAEERRNGLKVYVLKHEMEFFRLPR